MTPPTRVFVTGASSGLGAALALACARPGAWLGLVARREAELAAVAAAARARGAQAVVLPADVTDAPAMATVAGRFLGAAGGVDLVLANAGVGLGKSIFDASAADVARLFAINLTGVSNTVLPFLPAMRAARAGVLCAVSSLAGDRALPGHGAYAASKAGARTFMDGLRLDLAGTGVHAMTVCPGFVRTPMTAGNPRMPFVLDAEPAARAILAAVARRSRTYRFPWQMDLVRRVLVAVPEGLLAKLLPSRRSAR